MPSSEEALKSENGDDVKKCRASIKTQLKVDIKAIQAKLDNKEENGNYKFASISNEMMRDLSFFLVTPFSRARNM